MFFRCVVLSFVVAIGLSAQSPRPAGGPVAAPRFWNDRELADWATPIAALNTRPGHFSERDYYAAPDGEWVRTYPVYFPGREPAGYWDMVRAKKPEPLIASAAARGRSTPEWIAAGQIVFREIDVPGFRSTDPALIAVARSAAELTKRGAMAQKDGKVFGLRWVPTSKGLALSINDCAGCHTRVMPDGRFLDGAPVNVAPDLLALELVGRGTANFFPGDTPSVSAWRGFATPWIPNDIHTSMKTMSEADMGELFASNVPGTFPRFNGSPYYTTQIPDLNGIKDRKYIDHTATHRLRGPADVMRYAALVSCCDSADFGQHRLLTDAQRKVLYKLPDSMTFALAEYLFSIEPPKNPSAADPRAAAGRQVFDRQGCGSCHTAPLYTNNKLTLAKGYTAPADHPYRTDIMNVSVGTDSNLAMNTRKGTGFYKVPSLKGLWYRGLLGHDGSAASLEEWFDPARLRDDHVPGGFKGYKVTRRAIPGHEYGLKLSQEDRTALIAFLKTL